MKSYGSSEPPETYYFTYLYTHSTLVVTRWVILIASHVSKENVKLK